MIQSFHRENLIFYEECSESERREINRPREVLKENDTILRISQNITTFTSVIADLFHS
jgi:hypothetical protein